MIEILLVVKATASQSISRRIALMEKPGNIKASRLSHMNKLKTCGALLILMLLCCTNVTAQQNDQAEFRMDRSETRSAVDGRLGSSLLRGHSREDRIRKDGGAHTQNQKGILSLAQDNRVFKPKYSTLFGSDSTEVASSIAVRSNENIVIVGHTESPLFPVTSTGYSHKFAGGKHDGFIAIFSQDCRKLLSSTCFGGSANDYLASVRILPDGSIVVVGTTESLDLPVTENALQKRYMGKLDGFIAIFDSSCSILKYCSYIGGKEYDNISECKVGSNGMLYIAGSTCSTNFPCKHQIQNPRGGMDAFVYVLDPVACTLIFSSYFGGDGVDEAYSMNLDDHSNIYVFGYTTSGNLPTTSDALFGKRVKYNFHAGFIYIIDSAMMNRLYCSYISGSESDMVSMVDIDKNDNIYITGQTNSADFITTSGVYMPTYPKKYGPDVSYVMKLTKERKLEWSTFLGGVGYTFYYAIKALSDESVLLYGYSCSPEYPTTLNKMRNVSDTNIVFKDNVVLSILSKDASRLIYSKVSGGNDGEYGVEMKYENKYLYLCGATRSSDFPMSESAYQKINNGQYDMFLSVMNIDDLLMSIEKANDGKRTIEMKAWPNPVKDRLYVKLNSVTTTPEYYSLVISDTQGREVYRKMGEKPACTALTEQIEVGSLSSGVYVCKATLGRQMQTRKIVKR